MMPKPSQANLQEAFSLILVTSLCGAGGAALTTTANAAVVSTTGISASTPLGIPDNIDGVYLDVVTGANGLPASAPGWDINPYSATAGNLNWWGVSAATYLQPAGAATLSNVAVPAGTVVSSAGVFVRGGGGSSAAAGVGTGEFTLGATNYVGFQFLNEDTSQTHYGYLSIALGASFADRSLTGVFYENQPGIAITVAPEPSSALLAAGAAGLVALRRRRQAA